MTDCTPSEVLLGYMQDLVAVLFEEGVFWKSPVLAHLQWLIGNSRVEGTHDATPYGSSVLRRA